MSNILATGISKFDHMKVFDQIAQERLAELDLAVLLIYMIDTVPAEVLPILAEQFDLLGYKGWRFVDEKGPYSRKLRDRKALVNRVDGNFVSTPNVGANQLSVDLEICAYISYENNGTAQIIISKGISSSVTAYYLGVTSSNNLECNSVPSSVGIGASYTGWVRVWADSPSDGTTFYTSDAAVDTPLDQIVWTQLGTVNPFVATISNVNTPLVIGAYTDVPIYTFETEIYRVVVGNGINTLVEFDAEDYSSGSSFTSSRTGEVWTITEAHAPGGIQASQALWQVPEGELIAQQRELVKSAIELHRFKGTPWSIKEALRRVGFGGATIIEGVGQYYDGSFYHNGAVTYSGLNNWACFRVIFDLGNFKGINAAQTADLQSLIAEYKNARSKLVDLSFTKGIEDSVTMADEVAFNIELPAIEDGFTPYYNSEFRYTGIIQHTGYSEDVTITQIT